MLLLVQKRSLLPTRKGGRWDFESCTVYTDSSGAEICIPWMLATTPPQLQGAQLKQTCGDALSSCNVADHSATHVSDGSAAGTHATQAGCCSQCAALAACNVWVHVPSTNTCWLMMTNTTASAPKKCGGAGTQNGADRTVGFQLFKNVFPKMSRATADFGFLWNQPNFGSMSINSSFTEWYIYIRISAGGC